MAQGLRRSKRYGVGKEIGGAVYIHRRYEDVLGEVVAEAKERLPAGFEYQVVKYDARSGNVSFIESPDFDEADEPAVGEVVTVKPDGTVRRRRAADDPEIYHHKWLFVRDDYEGFDVEESRERSRAWTGLEGVDRTRIGRRSYWEREVVPRIGGSGQKD